MSSRSRTSGDFVARKRHRGSTSKNLAYSSTRDTYSPNAPSSRTTPKPSRPRISTVARLLQLIIHPPPPYNSSPPPRYSMSDAPPQLGDIKQHSELSVPTLSSSDTTASSTRTAASNGNGKLNVAVQNAKETIVNSEVCCCP
jgi:hypothetical protein